MLHASCLRVCAAACCASCAPVPPVPRGRARADSECARCTRASKRVRASHVHTHSALPRCRTHRLALDTANGMRAVASDDAQVRLIDLSTCGFTHTLTGHAGAVLCVKWLPA